MPRSNLQLAAEQRYTLDTGAVIDALAGLALAQQLQGRSDEATQTLDQLLEFSRKSNDPQGLSVAHSCRARLSLLRNELGPAMQWASSDHPTPAPASLFLWLEVPAITQARVLIVAGSKDSLLKATEILHKIRHQSEAYFFRNQTIEVAVLQSLALEKQGQADEALLALEEVLCLALPGGWLRPFVELGKPMADMLKRLKIQFDTDELGRFVDTILAAFSSTPAAPVHNQRPDQINPLTDRELQVLRFLVSSLSAGEIADELVVSVHTVRMHTKNIYSKLDAHSRIDAVEIAREMGLI